jgi:hypothetical protein
VTFERGQEWQWIQSGDVFLIEDVHADIQFTYTHGGDAGSTLVVSYVSMLDALPSLRLLTPLTKALI